MSSTGVGATLIFANRSWWVKVTTVSARPEEMCRYMSLPIRKLQTFQRDKQFPSQRSADIFSYLKCNSLLPTNFNLCWFSQPVLAGAGAPANASAVQPGMLQAGFESSILPGNFFWQRDTPSVPRQASDFPLSTAVNVVRFKFVWLYFRFPLFKCVTCFYAWW